MTIIIKQTFKDDFTTRVAGEKLRHMILNQHEKMTLDFSGVKIASSSFFDEGIAKLTVEGWGWDKIVNQVHIQNMHPMDLLLLENVCRLRGFNGSFHLKQETLT